MTVLADREVRTCQAPGCTNPLERKSWDSDQTWITRRFCSTPCVGAGNRKPVPARFCERAACGKELIRRPKESPRDYGGRKYCNPECSNLGRREAARVEQRRKRCHTCGKQMTKTRDISTKDWEAKRWCSNDCRYPESRGLPKEKVCTECGTKFTNVEGLRASRWVKKLQCSPDCREAALAPPLAGPHVKYDTPPPCYMDLEFFKEEERIRAMRSKPGSKPEGVLTALMDNVRDIWCLDCPLMQACLQRGIDDKQDGIAGGEWLSDGEVQ